MGGPLPLTPSPEGRGGKVGCSFHSRARLPTGVPVPGAGVEDELEEEDEEGFRGITRGGFSPARERERGVRGPGNNGK